VRVNKQPILVVVILGGEIAKSELERAQDRARRATARSFRDRRVVEQARNTLARRSARIAARQATINALQNISQKVSQYRSLSGNREAENLRNSIRSQEIQLIMSQEYRPSKRPTELDVLIAIFNRKVKLGPDQICLSCKGLWFPKHLNKLSRAYLKEHCEFKEEITKMQASTQRCHFQRPRFSRNSSLLNGAYSLGETTDFTSPSFYDY